MFKSVKKISNLSKIIIINQNNINSSATFLNINNNLKYLNILHYSKNHHDFTKRNSYTHKQDARAAKRREGTRDSEEMGGQVVGPGDIVTETNNPTISKPNHKHSKPVTHKKKLERLDHHHQKKIERDSKQKEEQRLDLLETLEREKENEENQFFKKTQKQREENEKEEKKEKEKKIIRNKRQSSKKQKAAPASFGYSSDEGITEYSEFKANLSEEVDTEITFEKDLSIYDSKHGITTKEFDISQIDESKIIQLEDLSFDEDEGVDMEDENEETLVLTMEEARKRFNLKDEDFNVILDQLNIDDFFKVMGDKKTPQQVPDLSESSSTSSSTTSPKKNPSVAALNEQQIKPKQQNETSEANEYLKQLFNKKYGSKEINQNPITIEEVSEFLGNSHLDDFFVVDVSNKCSWTKYLVVASSDSTRLLQNTQDDLVAHFKDRANVEIDPSNTSDWLVVNLKTVVVHLFETQKREYYDLETLWSTRRHIDYGKEESWDDEKTSKLEEDD
ncbi:hypothetical protein DICPUDRAFT_156550 [Dictyostelium purpureum]|uniref:Ribosomal silencing factor RsfS n=1 Tax=Dictyostelium purpureum TaxID=5786 RepID=F0ZWV5_DICPU|nr:uncharacterized protein DICPUDRAFT_156550 [Dictyostelium purpureum]EGC31589.1 hypothetical protein DICPUDRAFT_156550 [Dictyostelium purpureum]|eukprot:XP_003291900.1 hypothetical protein DICPUDRAFT_156550 [Dictyostelium purpureum]